LPSTLRVYKVIESVVDDDLINDSDHGEEHKRIYTQKETPSVYNKNGSRWNPEIGFTMDYHQNLIPVSKLLGYSLCQ
jgi:ferredoxin-thioredoxin reductase catalytic subunit